MDAIAAFLVVIAVVVVFFIIERLTERPFDALEARHSRRDRDGDGRER